MKKIGIILAVLIVAAGLAAANGTKEAPKGGAASGEQITLNLWHIGVDATRHAAMKAAIDRYQAANPNVKVIEQAIENDPYKTKLKTAMGGGNPPDVFITWGGGWLEEFVKAGKVLDINDRIAKVSDNYLLPGISMGKVGNSYYGLPITCGPSSVYYNAELYKKYGLSVPKTLSEFENNCDILKKNGIIPIALGNSSKWPGAITFIYLSMRYGGAETFTKAYARNGADFTDESFVKAGAKIQEWVKKGYYPEGMNGINYDTGGSRMLFYSGRAAHLIQTNGLLGACRSEAPDFFKNNLGLFKFPVIEGAKGSADEIVGGGTVVHISSSCKHPDEAFGLLVAVSDLAYGQDMVNGSSMITGVKGVNIKDPLVKQQYEVLLGAKFMQNFYDQYLPPALGEVHKNTTQALFGLTMTPEQAASEVEAKAVEILGPAKK
ncbi:extracellular solute-binding protein [Treponema parvum]|uniref:Extracellular solute-binding protein n=1 Tax=Treponema parvum TaxID=138851 RepID=A0A975F2W0_9SPIR|nr:extracellular solute-binding protein [Treponema parvum]QTQ13383.1 extracellular solute-binding protein [Treponema parvum]